MITIKDIAQAAGVTHSTVSRCLNDSPLVSKDTKTRINQLAQEMGYSPNIIARRLVTRRSRTLGLFFLSRDEVSFMENYGTQFLDGIARRSAERGYDLLFFTLTKDLANRTSYIKLCKERQVEGAIFIGVASDDPHLQEISHSSLPVGVIDFPMHGPLVGQVSSDNQKGVLDAMDYLWSLGHRRIGFLRGPLTAPVAQLRFKSYEDFLKSKRLPGQPWVFQGDFTRSSGEQAAQIFSKLPEPPTAVLAANDLMALGMMKKLKLLGMNVPRDLSIMGFDNALAAEFSEPGLTTVGQQAGLMGAGAVDYVVGKLEASPVQLELLVPPELIIRDSVGEIPSTGA